MMNRIKNFLSLAARLMMKPLQGNMAFFILSGLLISGNASWVPLRFPHGGWTYYWEPALTGLSRGFVVAYIVTILVSLLRNPAWLKGIIYAAATLFFTASCYLAWELNTPISPSMLLLLLETNAGETGEFFSQYLFNLTGLKYVALTAVVVALIILGENRQRAHMARQRLSEHRGGLKVSKYTIFGKSITPPPALIVFIILICGLGNHIALWSAVRKADKSTNLAATLTLGRYNWEIKGIYSDSFSSAMLSVKFLHRLQEVTQHWLAINETFLNDPPKVGKVENPVKVIFVLGESHSKLHSSDYGYNLTTMPEVTAEANKGNLYLFKDMVTPYYYTSNTIKNMMCLNSIGDDEVWNDAVYLPSVMRLGGYKVTLWDNQNDFTSNSKRASFDVELTLFQTADVFREKCYDFIYGPKHEYDGEMVDRFLADGKGSGGAEFAWVHFIGQHTNAKDRYPATEEWVRFTPSDYRRSEPWITEEKLQLIADYDNATHYIDAQLGRIFRQYQDETAVVIYISDHGEEMYDYRDNFGRRGNGVMTYDMARCLHEVPMMIWCSDSYKEKYPEVVAAIERGVDRPGMSDNLGHVIFHLARLTDANPLYRADRDMLSESYKCPRRIINDRIDYDALRAKETSGRD